MKTCTRAEDHAKGLSTFTIMAGLGGFMGYSLGGINWDDTAIGIMLGGHVRAVFTLVTIIFIVCVSATVTSFREIPLWRLEAPPTKPPDFLKDEDDDDDDDDKQQEPETNETTDVLDKSSAPKSSTSYGSLNQDQLQIPTAAVSEAIFSRVVKSTFLYMFSSKIRNDVTQCHRCQRIQTMQPFPVITSPKRVRTLSARKRMLR